MITHAVFLLAETIAVQSVYLIVIINLSQWPSQGEYLCRGYSATCQFKLYLVILTYTEWVIP